MTSELIKKAEIEKAVATAGESLFRHIFKDVHLDGGQAKNERLRDYQGRSFEGREHEYLNEQLSAIQDAYAHDKDGWQRCMDATMALLNQAYRMIDNAENTIKEQSKRISTLESVATTDDLTNIKNRRGFFEAFSTELDRCDRGLSEGGLLMLIDLDNFKAINDTHGHQAGDASLRLVAKTLQNEVRIMDTAARLGGDEFVLIFSNTNKQSIAPRAQALAWQLNHLSLAWYGEEIPIRASLGLQPYKAGDEMDKIFNAADSALYADKFHRKRVKHA